MFPGLTINSKGSVPLKTGSQISFGGGAPMQVQGNSINPIPQATYNPTAQPKPQGQQQQSNPATPSTPSIDFDSIYAPYYGALQQQQDVLQNQQFPTYQKEINDQANQQKSSLDVYGNQYENQYNQDNTQLNNQVNSAYGQALDQYNHQKMLDLNLFGGSSGQLGVEGLLNSAAIQTQGSLQNGYTQSLTQLMSQHQNFLIWMSNQKSAIDTQTAKAQDDLQNQLASALQSINQNRAMLDSQKAQQKAQVAANTASQISQINLNRQQMLSELDSYNQNFQQQLTAQGQQLAQQQAQFMGSNPFQNSSQAFNQMQPQQQQAQFQNGFVPGASQQQQYDQFGNLIQ